MRKDLNAYDIEMMRKTMTAKEIATVYKMTVNALYHWCRRNGTILQRATDWEIQEALETMNAKEIAFELNLTLPTVYRRIKQMGLNIKDYKYRGIKNDIR